MGFHLSRRRKVGRQNQRKSLFLATDAYKRDGCRYRDEYDNSSNSEAWNREASSGESPQLREACDHKGSAHKYTTQEYQSKSSDAPSTGSRVDAVHFLGNHR
jgi:hypothetical protein